MSVANLAIRSALFGMAALWAGPASAQSLYETQTSGDLVLVRATAMSMQCGLIDEATRTRALSNLKRAMRRHQAEAQISDADAQVDARFNAAVAEGEATPAERCDWYRRRPDAAARQAERIEMLAYGDARKSR